MIPSPRVCPTEHSSLTTQTTLPLFGETNSAADRRHQSNRLSDSNLGTFATNRDRAIHRWYPFVEGYSADLVNRALRRKSSNHEPILDPFGGSGTTALASALAGHDSYFCEVNPYLAWVAHVKVNSAAAAAASDIRWEGFRELKRAIDSGRSFDAEHDHPLVAADRERQFFPEGVAITVVGILRWIENSLDGPIADIAKLACTTALIPASNMIRRTDLRRRTVGDPPPSPVREVISRRLQMIVDDVESAGRFVKGRAFRIAADVRSMDNPTARFGLIVTSPPYLNGTNYCRNTKLELLALSFISSQRELRELRTNSIAAGINNISTLRSKPRILSPVEPIATALDKVTYDRRIPALVRSYFSDMAVTFERLRSAALPGAQFLLDIGDSRFAGVHVPTHSVLMKIAQATGWGVVNVETLRRRKSYDGSDLSQVLIDMRAV